MVRNSDDDALAWSGDDDPTLDVGGAAPANAPVRKADPAAIETPDAAPAALPDGFTAVGKGREGVGHIRPDGTITMPSEHAPVGNSSLIAIGVLGGVYLLYAVGWLIGAGRLSLIAQLFLDPIAFQVTLWLAVLAPPIWFMTVLVLARRARPWVRLSLLAAGAIVLIPWPFVIAGAAL